MSKIWITSDLHFCHNRDFLYEPRGFSNPYDMNNEIVKNWNSLVAPEDDVYVLGDLMLNDDNLGIKLLKSLKGKIHIIRGNHDTTTRIEKYLDCYNVVEVVNSWYLDYQKFHFYLSHYPTITSNNDYEKPLRQRLLNLCGHSHTKDRWADADKGYIYHCELDAHDNKPVLLDDIISDFEQKYWVRENTRYTTADCEKCVWQNFLCPGPNGFRKEKCPEGHTFKRDPPDGGYYG